MKDPRAEFSAALCDAGATDERIVAVSCDSASGSGMAAFRERHPDRFIEVGISEQHAISMCAGLAREGMVPVVSAIAPFISMRCYEQVRNDLGYARSAVVVVGSSSGLSHSTLGISHQAVEDVALMRTVPGMTILNPGDALEVRASVHASVTAGGPVYLRMPRHPMADIRTLPGQDFAVGRARVASLGEVVVLATGTMVAPCQQAVDALRSRGEPVGLADVHTLEPLDTELLTRLAASCTDLVTVEEHSTNGGLGSIVAERVAELGCRVRLHRFGVPPGAVETGPYQALLEHHGLTASALEARLSVLLDRRVARSGEATARSHLTACAERR